MISIIIPVKNGTNYITEAINGIKNQKLPVEIIVVDDNSDDETVQVAESLGCKVVKHTTTKGQVAGKNTGLKFASGDFIMFHDHDDILTPNALKTMIDNFDTKTAVIMAKIQDFLSPDSKNKTQVIKPSPYYGCLAGSILFRKEVFGKIGYFDEGITSGEIIALTNKLEKYSINIKKIDFISSYRRIHDTNYGKTNRKDEFKDYTKLLREKLLTKTNK